MADSNQNDLPLSVLKSRLTARKAANVGLDMPSRRASLDELGGRARLPDGVTIEDLRIGELSAEWVRPSNANSERAVLYLHGGGFSTGTCKSHRSLAASLAVAIGAAVLSVEYRLAPEHRFPAAHDDAFDAYAWLRASLDDRMDGVAVVGDSAGGNLAVACVARAIAELRSKPGCLVLLSPWLDLRCVANSFQRSDNSDPVLSLAMLHDLAKSYCPDAASLEAANTLGLNLHGFPPALVQVGSEELLVDDCRAFCERLSASGGNATLEIWTGLFHVWHAFAPALREARESIARIGAFVGGHLQ